MKTICLYFNVHQPLRLKKYRFFNMGKDHNYLDDPANRQAVLSAARLCYLPVNTLLKKLIAEYGEALKISFYISGASVEQFRNFAPAVLDSFKEIAATGCVEFVGGTYSHSLASLLDDKEFERSVKQHSALMKKEFGQTPKSFCNTEMIYSDEIGKKVADMGFSTILAEGAKHILGWKSPNYVYAGALNQKQRLLLRNYKLSDDIALRFSSRSWDQWPLTAAKFVSWMTNDSVAGEVINLFMDYETIGMGQPADTGIFDFIKYLPKSALGSGELSFSTVSQAAAAHQPVAVLHSQHPMSWRDEERDTTAWNGNELQNEALSKLYMMKDKIYKLSDPDFDYVWNFMQDADNFYYMATKWFSAGEETAQNPYGSSYEAFINYMNILSDFEIEVDKKLAEKKSKIKQSC